MSGAGSSKELGVGPGPKRYVVGFMLSADRTEVVLIEKQRPAWQAGFLNGVGGKVEPGETLHEAMAREFHEETGVLVLPSRWDHVCTVTWEDDQRVDAEPSSVAFFRHVAEGNPPVRSMTDEQVVIRRLDRPLPWDDVIPNLTWLIPLAAYRADNYRPFTVVATVSEVLPHA